MKQVALPSVNDLLISSDVNDFGTAYRVRVKQKTNSPAFAHTASTYEAALLGAYNKLINSLVNPPEKDPLVDAIYAYIFPSTLPTELTDMPEFREEFMEQATKIASNVRKMLVK